MNATKTISRNRIREKQLNNLTLVGLHSPSVCAAASDARVHDSGAGGLYLIVHEGVGLRQGAQMPVQALQQRQG